ncbi:MAG: hypothetical protein ACTHM9_15195 [Gemmatimonadales bacterium]
MRVQEHSTVREGTIAGVIGAVVMAVWYLVVDSAGGQPLHTPNVLGKIFFRGDLAPSVTRIVPGVVIGYTVLHFVLFILVGMGLTLLVHLAVRNTTLRMGLWIGFLIALGTFATVTYLLSAAAGERFSPWSVISGSVLGVLGMAGYLWRRHPRLSRSFQESPLGSEVPPPPHPPERPRAA